MNRIKTCVGGTRIALLALAVIFIGAGIAQATAATTIGTDITTTGALTVSGLSSLGQATSTMFSAYKAYFGGTATSTFAADGSLTLKGSLTGKSGDIITNTVASTTVISGNLTIGDGTAINPGLTITNAANATSTLSVGCIQATATSSATKIKIVFSTLGATTTFAGTAYWNYGTCP